MTEERFGLLGPFDGAGGPPPAAVGVTVDDRRIRDGIRHGPSPFSFFSFRSSFVSSSSSFVNISVLIHVVLVVLVLVLVSGPQGFHPFQYAMSPLRRSGLSTPREGLDRAVVRVMIRSERPSSPGPSTPGSRVAVSIAIIGIMIITIITIIAIIIVIIIGGGGVHRLDPLQQPLGARGAPLDSPLGAVRVRVDAYIERQKIGRGPLRAGIPQPFHLRQRRLGLGGRISTSPAARQLLQHAVEQDGVGTEIVVPRFAKEIETILEEVEDLVGRILARFASSAASAAAAAVGDAIHDCRKSNLVGFHLFVPVPIRRQHPLQQFLRLVGRRRPGSAAPRQSADDGAVRDAIGLHPPLPVPFVPSRHLVQQSARVRRRLPSSSPLLGVQFQYRIVADPIGTGVSTSLHPIQQRADAAQRFGVVQGGVRIEEEIIEKGTGTARGVPGFVRSFHLVEEFGGAPGGGAGVSLAVETNDVAVGGDVRTHVVGFVVVFAVAVGTRTIAHLSEERFGPGEAVLPVLALVHFLLGLSAPRGDARVVGARIGTDCAVAVVAVSVLLLPHRLRLPLPFPTRLLHPSQHPLGVPRPSPRPGVRREDVIVRPNVRPCARILPPLPRKPHHPLQQFVGPVGRVRYPRPRLYRRRIRDGVRHDPVISRAVQSFHPFQQ
mmetsp:Transcript_42881/g.130466  ORF Transcript_42881/g.130466 Transcript_42881/m.130466 type:complete len:661 (+) Transcript_42881:1190-3172(+)